MASHTEPAHPVAVANRSVEARAEAYYVPRLRSAVHGALQTIARRAASRLHRTAVPVSGGWNPPDLDEIMPKAECDALLADAVGDIEARVFDRIYRESVGAAVVAATYRPPDATSAEMWGQIGAQVTNVSDTTRVGIRDAMMQGWDQGLSVSETGDLIREDFAASIERAEMIARTEYTRIANGSTIAAGQSAGLGAKTWLTAPGAPHPRHELVDGLDGQTVALTDDFDVSGYPGAYPGDPNLPAEESINCRCSLLLHESVADAFPAPPAPPDMVATAPPPGAAAGSPEAFAARLWKQAAGAEPAVTRDLMRVADAAGGQMIGLEWRMKTADRLADKIARKAASKGLSLEESALDLGDTLRYTAQYETERYAASVDKMLSDLEAEGYRPVEVKNYWEPGDDYQGINAIFLDPHGQKFELQFHTPESWKVKNDTHSLYQQMQEATDPKVKIQIWREMVKMSEENIPRPHGDVLRIGELTRHAPPRVALDVSVPGPNAKAAFDKKLVGAERERLREIRRAETSLEQQVAAETGHTWDPHLRPEIRQEMLKRWSQERMLKRIAENPNIDLEAIRKRLGLSYPDFVQVWSTAADEGELARIVQAAAAERWNLELPNALQVVRSEELRRAAEYVADDIGELLHEQWENTQEFFRTHNITTLTLYRGFIGSYKDYGDGGNLYLDTSPLSAWTTDIDAAWSFAWGGQGAAGKGGDTRYIASMTVPVDRVQSCYGTGLGVENEKEYIVVGGVETGGQGIQTDFVHLTLIGEPGQLAVPEQTIEERKREQERGVPTTRTPT